VFVHVQSSTIKSKKAAKCLYRCHPYVHVDVIHIKVDRQKEVYYYINVKVNERRLK
jgi:uncharacterized protein involved in tolerance to divalent cations